MACNAKMFPFDDIIMINDIHAWYTHWPYYEPGDCLNDIKIPSFEHRDPHDKDKMISQLSYLYYENPHVWKDSLDIETGPCVPLIIPTVVMKPH